MSEFICKSLDDTKNAAKYFARFAKAGQCFALFGDLGYGKTTFTKYLIQTLNGAVECVTSPTFTIVQTYESSTADILHIDCYRLKSKEEFVELGLEEMFPTCITIIEWPEVVQELLPNNTIKISFEMRDNVRKICELSSKNC